MTANWSQESIRMKHLDLEVEKLEQRIAPGGFGGKPRCGGGGSSKSGGSKSGGSKSGGSKSGGSKSGSKSGGSKGGGKGGKR